ncbi:MAG: Competence protein [Cyanobacteriota bacterium]
MRRFHTHGLTHPQSRYPRWLLKQSCCRCDRPSAVLGSRPLCATCHRELQACQRPTPLQLNPQRIVWGHYQGALRQLMHRLKYQHQPAIADLFGQHLAQLWPQHQLPILSLVPIPLHPHKQAQRGYNQAELIARSLSQWSHLPLTPDLLQRSQDTIPQHGLSLVERQTNLEQAFAIGGCRLPQGAPPLLLVDDIYTTGTTIAMATQTLAAHGYQVWGSIVVAA